MTERDDLNQAIAETFIDKDPMGPHRESFGPGNAGPGFGKLKLGPFLGVVPQLEEQDEHGTTE